MQEYRVYIIGSDGHFLNSLALECADDNAAIERAKQFVNGTMWNSGNATAR